MSYNPNQPRDPAGSETGGQWSGEQLDTIGNAARKGAGLSDKTGVLSYEQWSLEKFGKVYKREGIFAAQYDKYFDNFVPEKTLVMQKVKDLSNMNVKTYGDFKKKVRNFIESENQNGDQYNYYGIRFEEKDRSVGDFVNNSMHNPDRIDERDFPLFGTKEYKNLQQLNGSSAWNIDMQQNEENWTTAIMASYNTDKDIVSQGGHAYIVAGNSDVTHSDADPNEIVIQDAIVVRKIY
jgi:hypothetical protein